MNNDKIEIVKYDLESVLATVNEGNSVRPYVLASYSNNVEFSILFDSGSPINLIDYGTWKRFFRQEKILTSNKLISDVQGKSILVMGCIQLPYSIGNTAFNDNFLIVGHVHTPILIIGYPTCKANSVSLHPEKNGIHIGREFIRHVDRSFIHFTDNSSVNNVTHFQEPQTLAEGNSQLEDSGKIVNPESSQASKLEYASVGTSIEAN